MKKVFGRLLFWLTWPLIWLYSPLLIRPRIIVMHGREFLAVKPYFGSGAWQLPGGGMRMGESQAAAAIRELAEETGVIVDSREVTPLLSRAAYKEKGIIKRYSIFAVKLDKKPAITPQQKEIGEAAWLPLAETSETYFAHIQAALSAIKNISNPSPR